MADAKITELTALAATPDTADVLPIVDDPAGSPVTKKITVAYLLSFFNTVTATLTNKRITARVKSFTSDATPDINSDNYDAVTITAQAEAITDVAITGTPTNFQKLLFRIKDNGTGRAITWGSDFEAKGVALPTTTTASKVLTVGFIYDTVTSKWGCVASAVET